MEDNTSTWASLQVGQIVKVRQNERFPADLILLKSSNSNGIAYVETIKLDGETNLKHKSAIRDMQDAILSETDAGQINGHIYCEFPNEFLYSFDALMTIKVKNSQDSYKYLLDHNQLLLRGSSLKATQWIYGIVVYTGEETKVRMHQRRVLEPQRLRTTQVESLMNKFVKQIFTMQIFAAAYLAFNQVQFEHTNSRSAFYLELDSTGGLRDLDYRVAVLFPQVVYLVRFCSWLLCLMEYLPVSFLVSVSLARFIQSSFVSWDISLFSCIKSIEPRTG